MSSNHSTFTYAGSWGAHPNCDSEERAGLPGREEVSVNIVDFKIPAQIIPDSFVD